MHSKSNEARWNIIRKVMLHDFRRHYYDSEEDRERDRAFLGNFVGLTLETSIKILTEVYTCEDSHGADGGEGAAETLLGTLRVLNENLCKYRSQLSPSSVGSPSPDSPPPPPPPSGPPPVPPLPSHGAMLEYSQTIESVMRKRRLSTEEKNKKGPAASSSKPRKNFFQSLQKGLQDTSGTIGSLPENLGVYFCVGGFFFVHFSIFQFSISLFNFHFSLFKK